LANFYEILQVDASQPCEPCQPTQFSKSKKVVAAILKNKVITKDSSQTSERGEIWHG